MDWFCRVDESFVGLNSLLESLIRSDDNLLSRLLLKLLVDIVFVHRFDHLCSLDSHRRLLDHFLQRLCYRLSRSITLLDSNGL